MNWKVEFWYTEDDTERYEELFHDMLSANKFYEKLVEVDNPDNPFSAKVTEMATGYSYTFCMKCIGCAKNEHGRDYVH